MIALAWLAFVLVVIAESLHWEMTHLHPLPTTAFIPDPECFDCGHPESDHPSCEYMDGDTIRVVWPCDQCDCENFFYSIVPNK
jgi:hypothetical protein